MTSLTTFSESWVQELQMNYNVPIPISYGTAGTKGFVEQCKNMHFFENTCWPV